MPKGVPKAGFRMTKNRVASGVFPAPAVSSKLHGGCDVPATPPETDAEIHVKLEERFSVMQQMAAATAHGSCRACIISGPAGLGKSFGVEKILEGLESKGITYTTIKGFIRPTGLYKILYEYRHPNCVVVFDDADSVFLDDVSLNLLKTACDTTEKRVLHWAAETRMEDEGGDKMPRSYEFEGSVIFITNYDFDAMIARQHRLSVHFEALISRSHYLDLAMKTRRDYLIRIKQVVAKGMLRKMGLNAMEEFTIVNYIEKHQDKLRELSLRMVVKLATLYKINKSGWENIAKVTCLKGVG